MSLARVQKQLIRDIKRSPAKAAALAALCVVAIYFWSPLVMGWFGKSSKKSRPSDPAAVVPSVAVVVEPVAIVKEVWHEVIERRQQDPRMQSAVLGQLTQAPFGLNAAATDETDNGDQPVVLETQSRLVDVNELGLKLSSTMLGPRRRVAVINGRPYAEGSTLEMGEEGTLIVSRVGDRSVWLEFGGQRFELSLAK